MYFLIPFVLLSLLAEILGTVGGFGSSVLFVPIAGFFFDFHSVLGITALFHVASNLSKIALFRKGIDKKLLLTMGVPAVVFVIAGAYLTRFFDNKLLEMVLAVFLILLSVLLLIFKTLRVKPTAFNSAVGGALSGLAAGMVGTGGAIRGLTMAAFNLEINIFIATSAAIDFAIDISRSVVYFTNGYMHMHDMYLIPILFIISVTGTYIGKRILHFFSQEQFSFFVLILIMCTGILTFVRQLM